VESPVADVLLTLCVFAFVLESRGRPSLVISEHWFAYALFHFIFGSH
jgi:hypothetical protein